MQYCFAYLMVHQLLMGILMLEFDSFLNYNHDHIFNVLLQPFLKQTFGLYYYYYYFYMHNRAPVLENDTQKLLWDFNIQTDHLILARSSDLIIINNKKMRICKIVDFAVPVDHRINLKECEKDKYLDLARELKKLWNMKVTIVPIVIGALSRITKGLLKGLEDLEVGGRVDTIQMKALLRTARILRRVLETRGDLLSLRLQWKTIS